MTSIAFGEWLQNELNKRGWSKTDLARKSGVSASQITRLIKGERGIKGDTLYALAIALKLPPEEVFLISIGKKPDNKMDEWIKEHSHLLKLIPASMRGVASKFIESITSNDEQK